MKYIKKYWIKIMSLGFGLLIAISLILFSQNSHLNNRLDTVNNNFNRLIIKDSTLMEEIKFQQFKEDSYLKQIDRDTNLILWFVAIMFGVFGLISFASFNRRVEQIESTLEDKYEGYIEELKDLKIDINDLKADLHSDSATLHSEQADKFLKEKEYDLYVFYKLLSLRRSAYYYLHNKNKHPKLAKSTLAAMTSSMTLLESNISAFENKPSIDKKGFDFIANLLRKVNDVDLNLLTSKIHVNLNLKSDEEQ